MGVRERFEVLVMLLLGSEIETENWKLFLNCSLTALHIKTSHIFFLGLHNKKYLLLKNTVCFIYAVSWFGVIVSYIENIHFHGILKLKWLAIFVESILETLHWQELDTI